MKCMVLRAAQEIWAEKRKTHTDIQTHKLPSSLIFPCHYALSPSRPQATPEQGKRTELHHKTPKTVTWALENNGEKSKQEEEKVTREVLEQRRLQKLEKAGIKVLPAAVRYSRSERMGMRSAAVVVVQQFWSCWLTKSCDGNFACGLFWGWFYLVSTVWLLCDELCVIG